MADAGSGAARRFGSVTASDVLANACVLIVDDYKPNVVALEAILRAAGLSRVQSVTDPRQVVEMYRRTEFDLIMLDLHMPGMDGVAVLDRLAQVIPEEGYLPVLMLTADATLEAKQRALAAGAKDFVTKPFDVTEVVLRVKNLLETRALHSRLRASNVDLAAQLQLQAERDRHVREERHAKMRRIRKALDGDGLTMVFQPIADLATGEVVGVEALARFGIEPIRPPNVWFAEAAQVGLGVALELAAVRAALTQARELPAGMSVSLNASPATVTDPAFVEVVRRAPAGRVIVELTEHVEVHDYEPLLASLRVLQTAGVRLAVDDAGAGFATMQHIVSLRPQIIKLDIALTRGIDSDPVRRALGRALVSFAGDIGASITAEGIETASELATLRRLGVPAGQGYFLARPGSISDVSRHLAIQR